MNSLPNGAVSYNDTGLELESSEVISPNETGPSSGPVLVSKESSLSPKYFWLYGFHASSLWSERLFDFAVGLFLAKTFTGTLLVNSIYGLVAAIAPMLLSFKVGQWIDSSKKLTAVKITLLLQKTAQGFVYLSLAMLGFRRPVGTEKFDTPDYIFFSVLLLSSAVTKLSSVGIKIGIERHWLVVLTKGNSKILAGLNAFLRRIELVCGVGAPFFISLLTKYLSTQISSICLAAWAIGSLVVEICIVLRFYSRFPILSETERLVEESKDRDNFSTSSLSNILIFIRDPLFLTSLSFAMLFCNVLSFGGSMLAYVKKIGFSDFSTALISGGCTFTGLVGTFLAPRLTSATPLKRAGAFFLFQESFYLTLIIVAIYTLPDGSPLFSTFLIIGVIMARIGLCGFDLVQTQLIQEGVTLDQLGLYTGFQFGMTNTFDLLSYSLTIIWSNPDDFKYPALVSWLVVCLSFCIYLRYVLTSKAQN